MAYTLPNMLMGMLVGGPKRCSNSAILNLKLPLTVVSSVFAAELVALSFLSVTHCDVNNVFCDVMAVHSALSTLNLSS
jgi:hypothetical protein